MYGNLWAKFLACRKFAAVFWTIATSYWPSIKQFLLKLQSKILGMFFAPPCKLIIVQQQYTM